MAWGLGVLLAVVLAAPAWASRVVLKIEATNVQSQPQTKEIRSNLPAGIGTNAVISTDGLEVRYDVKSGSYYVYGKVDLAPRQTVSYRVELADVWVVPESELNELARQVASLVDKLKGQSSIQEAEEIRKEIDTAVSAIRKRQDENSIKAGVKPQQHIRAYEINRDALHRVKIEIGKLENLVLGSGQDPGSLLGEVAQGQKTARDVLLKDKDYKPAVIRITAQNTSPTSKRVLEDFRTDLPPEVRPGDVLDPAGLDVGTDAKTGRCYVYRKDLELEPGQQVTFNVVIRDKWNVNGPRAASLLAQTTDLLDRVKAMGKFGSVEQALEALQAELQAVEKEKGPTTLNEKYVAYYRDQGDRVDVVEQKLNRIKDALKPIDKNTKMGFKAKPPSAKSTWLIIYIILGFLAILSLLFFFRWYGASRVGETK
jgi:hypothetical protein